MMGGVAVRLTPLSGNLGSREKQRKVDIRINVDLATLPGPPGFLSGLWIQVGAGCITGADVAAWPYCVSFLLLWFSALGSGLWESGALWGLFLGGRDSL